MSLFENEEYQWRETFFILFEESARPIATKVETALKGLDPRHIVSNVRADENGLLESLTLAAPDDYSAMDISLVRGEEVLEQTADLVKELSQNVETADERKQVDRLSHLTCRFDVYHFEQLVFVGRDDDAETDDFMDPGTVLIVMETLAHLCKGTVVDPQANTLL